MYFSFIGSLSSSEHVSVQEINLPKSVTKMGKIIPHVYAFVYIFCEDTRKILFPRLNAITVSMFAKKKEQGSLMYHERKFAKV